MNTEWPFYRFLLDEIGMIGGKVFQIQSYYNLRDENQKLRQSHENLAVQQLYKSFLGQPLSDKAHELLHTRYLERGV